MFYRLSRRHHVVIFTCILALAPLGVALARIAGVSIALPGRHAAVSDQKLDRNGRAVIGSELSQYGDRKGGFDIRLPASTGPQTALPKEVLVPGFNSLKSLDSVGATSATRNYGSAWSVERGNRLSELQRPRRGAPSFATGGGGMQGVGAWGGASGVGQRRAATTTASAAPKAQATVAAAPPKAPAASTPAPSRGSSGNSGSGSSNSGSGSGSGSSSSGDPAQTASGAPATGDAAAAAPAAAAAVPAAATPGSAVTAAGPVVTPAAGGIGGSVASAANPEPLSFLLVGTGLLGLYRARRYLA